ncbi:hypothetical protein [Amycolatopsis japonica]
MMLEIVMVVGVVGRCVLELAKTVAYRWRIRAWASLLTAVAALPEGAEVAEKTADGSTWRVSISRRPNMEAA